MVPIMIGWREEDPNWFLWAMAANGAITNTAFARFYAYEGTFLAMDSFRTYIERYGIPQSVYVDRQTTYRSTKKPTLEEELEGKRRSKSQFERALDELGVEVIPAYSPQAKGRI